MSAHDLPDFDLCQARDDVLQSIPHIILSYPEISSTKLNGMSVDDVRRMKWVPVKMMEFASFSNRFACKSDGSVRSLTRYAKNKDEAREIAHFVRDSDALRFAQAIASSGIATNVCIAPANSNMDLFIHYTIDLPKSVPKGNDRDGDAFLCHIKDGILCKVLERIVIPFHRYRDE